MNSISFNTIEANKYFENTDTFHIMLTNKCNLHCPYCQEQHEKDFNFFTEDSLWELYNKLITLSTEYKQKKEIIFFGGEPLLKKKLILNFLKKYSANIEKNNIKISIKTNGLLLSKNFIDEYFSYPFTYFGVSLDINDSEIDNRGLKQDQINQILDIFRYIKENKNQELYRVAIHATLSKNQIDQMYNFVKMLNIDYGIKNFLFHPLTFIAKGEKIIKWTLDDIQKVKNIIFNLLSNFDFDRFTFVDEVTSKEKCRMHLGN